MENEEGISSGYREKDFAVVNFLALLGWNDGTDKEIYTLEELVEVDLNRVHKAGAKFDPEKNKWFNHQYLIKQKKTKIWRKPSPYFEEKELRYLKPH
jgi:glutamyl-tRNA synthetase